MVSINKSLSEDSDIFQGYLYDQQSVLEVANNNSGYLKLDVRIATKLALEWMEFVDSMNHSRILLFELIERDDMKDFACMTSNLTNILNPSSQKHIPLLYFQSGSVLKYILKIKQQYLKSARTIKTLKDNEEITEDRIKIVFNRRMANLRKRCKNRDYPMPVTYVFWDKLQESIKAGFKCEYCGQELRFKGQAQQKGLVNYEDLYSFDHRIPLADEGTHSKENIIIACLCCNKIKGRLPEETFLDLIHNISSKTKYALLKDILSRDSRYERAMDYKTEQIQTLESNHSKLKKKYDRQLQLYRELINSR